MGLVPSQIGANVRELPPDLLAAMKLDFGPEKGDEAATNILVDSKTGHITHLDDDGGVTIDTQPDKPKRAISAEADDHDANLAEFIDDNEMAGLAAALHEGVERDLETRRDWDEAFNKGIDLLGLKLEQATSSIGSEGTVSKVYHPLLLETTVRYQANFVAEMLPSSGPVKVRDDYVEPPAEPNPMMGHNGGPPLDDEEDQQAEIADAGAPATPAIPEDRTALADAFEKDLNHYFTTVAREFYPDTDRMAFSQGFCGNGFKKQFHCPLRRRPVSESIPAQDLIVSNNATDLYSAIRVTHRSKMSESVMKRMMLTGAYRDVVLAKMPTQPSTTSTKIGSAEGIDKTPSMLPADQEYTVYEIYCDIDLRGFEHKNDEDEPTGLPLPYIVTMDKESQTILAVRRNWKEGDDDYKKKMRIVHFPLIPGLGFYAYGFIHLLGNTDRALTAIMRLLIDAGQFSCYPGFLVAKSGAKQMTNDLRIGPGSGREIDTGGKPINETIMKLPYNEPSAALQQMAQHMEEGGMRLGGAAQIPVGEGRTDIPVGTMLAGIEQMNKPLEAIHKRNHSAQQQEMQNMKELFVEDPKALWKFAKKPARKWQIGEELTDLELVPASDPNVPSHVHRLMVATALVQILQAPVQNQELNAREIYERAFKVLGEQNIEALFKPPPPPGAAAPPPDPKVMAAMMKAQSDQASNQIKTEEMQRKANSEVLEHQQRMQEIAAEAATSQQNLKDKQADRAVKLRIAELSHTSKQQQTHADISKQVLGHISDHAKTHIQHQHERGLAHIEHAHDATMANAEMRNQGGLAAIQHRHDMHSKAVDQQHETRQTQQQQTHDAKKTVFTASAKAEADKAKAKAKPKTTQPKKGAKK